MHAELKAISKRVRKLILVRDIYAPHRLNEISHHQMREKHATWRRNNGFGRIEVQDEWQHRSHGCVCSVDDPKHYRSNVYFDSRRSPRSQELT